MDLLIIGGGPAGISAAFRAARQGMSVVLFESNQIGGNCLNTGCVPTKSMLHSAQLVQKALSFRYGHTLNALGFDMGAAVARKNNIVRKMSLELQQNLEDCKITVVPHEARVTQISDDSVSVTANDVVYTARHLLICSGSTPIIPHLEGIEQRILAKQVILYDSVGNTFDTPQTLCILGKDKLAYEIAQIYQAAGSIVTVLNPNGRGMTMPDEDYANYFEDEIAKSGIRTIYQANVTEIDQCSVIYKVGQEEAAITADMVLIAMGRRPVLRGLGFELLALARKDEGIAVDSHMRTSRPNVWAAGDCVGEPMLAHVGMRQAEVAVDNILGIVTDMDYTTVPIVSFTLPHMACVGQTKHQARQQHLDAWEIEVPLHTNYRFLVENVKGSGLAKFVLDGDRVIGFHMVGELAHELCAAAAIMITSGLPISKLRHTMTAHMTMCELLDQLLGEAEIRFRRRAKK